MSRQTLVEGDLGVTRVARLTGLDRTGIEVACAIRPTGHVLQVANGKGASWATARASAIGEAAELWASERIVPEELRYGTSDGLRAAGFTVWDGPLGSAGDQIQTPAHDLWDGNRFAAFREGRDLFTGRPVLVPAAAVHCPAPGAAFIGPLAWRWTTNGLGAHPQQGIALRKAMLEAIERHELAQALPQGWTEATLVRRALQTDSLPPRIGRLQGRLLKAGFDLVLCDATPSKRIGLPVAAALLVDREHGPHPVTAGYACAADPAAALEGAALEAAQARLTDIHGGRDDVEPMDRRDAEQIATWVRRLRPKRSFRALPAHTPSRTAALLWRAGHRRAAMVPLTPASSPLQVVKVVVPSFAVSELL